MKSLDDCIEWKGARLKAGYGRKYVDGRCYSTHRLAYEWANGPIPDGLVVMHSCDNPPCCNPRHLSVGTIGDNNRDSFQRGRGLGSLVSLYCQNDHMIAGDNLYVRPNGRRVCRACKNHLEKLRKRRMRATH